MNIKIINSSGFELPKYETIGSAGMDLKCKECFVIEPFERKIIKTGLFMEIPKGYEGQVRPRSGHSLKSGLMVILGTIDSDYRGEVGVIVINLSNKVLAFEKGERVAQMVFNKVEQVDFIEVTELSDTERGSGGFGSTGVK